MEATWSGPPGRMGLSKASLFLYKQVVDFYVPFESPFYYHKHRL